MIVAYDNLLLLLQSTQAFSSYNENGKSEDAVRCLRRMIICNILSGSEVNPFDAQEIMACVD